MAMRFNNWDNFFSYAPANANWDYQLRRWSTCDAIVLTDFMLNTSEVTPAMLKARNPNIKVFLERTNVAKNNWESDYSSGWVPVADYTGLQYPLYLSDIVDNDWWLRDTNGDEVYETVDTGIRIVDVGKTGVKELFAERLLAQLDAVEGLDGVGMDYWHPHPHPWWSGDSIGYLDYESDAEWFENAWQPFVTYWTAAIKAAGYKIFANCPGEYDATWHWESPTPTDTSDSNEVSMWQRTKIDGANYELWVVTGSTSYYAASDVESRMESFRLDPLEIVSCSEYSLRPGALGRNTSYESDLNLHVAMYYLSLPQTGTRLWWIYNTCYTFYHPLMSWDIGAPSSAAATKHDTLFIWWRNFADGYVVMNFEGSSQSHTLPAGNWHDVYGKEYSGNITLAAHSAHVLRKYDTRYGVYSGSHITKG